MLAPLKAKMKTDLTISVLIPTYNMGHLLGPAIRSVLDQSSVPDEILVFDNASTDGTQEVVAAFAGAVIYVRHPENIGMYANLNAGVEACGGEYVKVFCADDLLHRDAIATIRQALEASGRPALLCADATAAPDFLERPVQPAAAQAIEVTMRDAILGKVPAGLPNVCFRREEFLRFGMFGAPDAAKDFSRDVATTQRFLGAHRGYYLRASLIYERPHPGQSRYSLNKAHQLGELLAVVHDNGLQLDDAVKRRMDEWVAHHLVAALGRIAIGKGLAYSRIVLGTLCQYRAFRVRQLAIACKRVTESISTRIWR